MLDTNYRTRSGVSHLIRRCGTHTRSGVSHPLFTHLCTAWRMYALVTMVGSGHDVRRGAVHHIRSGGTLDHVSAPTAAQLAAVLTTLADDHDTAAHIYPPTDPRALALRIKAAELRVTAYELTTPGQSHP